jgi:hypothetical protein
MPTGKNPITDREKKLPAGFGANLQALTGSDLAGKIAYAIAMVESGGNPNAVNFKNNNPGNLRTWGKTPTEGGFAKFADMKAGVGADLDQIHKNIKRGLSLNEFFAGRPEMYSGYSPSADKNRPLDYAAAVAAYLGIDANTPLDQIPSAARGMEVPGGMGAMLALLHPKEWVLPADISTGLRRVIGIGSPDLSDMHAANQRAPEVTPRVAHQHVNFTIDLGGISITQPGASLQQIRSEVSNLIDEKMRREIQLDLVQLNPVW